MAGYPALAPLWAAALLGWGLVAAGLWRGMSGLERRAALLAHGMTPAGMAFLCAILGFGLLYAAIVLTAEWWALLLVTRLRPERLTRGGAGLRALAAWATLGFLGAYVAFRLLP